jgi:glycosyltransferase involved in cell wall biosynthesis/UDP-N-acetylglucosamine:LPS N-acetylglucosamine transferase
MITVAIPTLGREDVLINTVQSLLALKTPACEIILIDQTDKHSYKVFSQLQLWDAENKVRWIRVQYKSITRAMNIALRRAASNRVLFLDDDIIPDEYLIKAHIESASRHPSAIIAGRVLQPWHHGKADRSEQPFLFNSLEPRKITSFMGGNVSVPRQKAIELGGFDTNFVRVAYHFEAEFAHRWITQNNEIFYEPSAIIHHLKVARGGTRTYGSHLTTLKPDHAVGRYYFCLCKYSLKHGFYKSLLEVLKSTRTRHHLTNPIWIPLTLFAEISGLLWALVLYQSGKGTIKSKDFSLLIVSSHPIQYYSPIFRLLSKLKQFKTSVVYLTLPDSRSQSLGFGQDFTWDIPLLTGHEYSVVKSSTGKGLVDGFMGVKIKKPMDEVKTISTTGKPDAVLITGWHFWGMVQLFVALKLSNIPIILRMDSNSLRSRAFLIRWIYKIFFSWIDVCLAVGIHNRQFCIDLGVDNDRIIRSPHVVDNSFFLDKASAAKSRQSELRSQWHIPNDAFCFIFAGKLQKKKRPFDLLNAFKSAYDQTSTKIHLLIVGSGPLGNECLSFCSKHDLPVTFAGFLNQTYIPEAYAVSDCIVLPSDEGETWGLVINEAMACGLPAIVSSSVGCAPDLVKDGYTGFQYTCGDTEKLTNQLLYVCENPELSKRMGMNAQKLIHEEYSLEHVARSVETAMKRING